MPVFLDESTEVEIVVAVVHVVELKDADVGVIVIRVGIINVAIIDIQTIQNKLSKNLWKRNKKLQRLL